MEDSSMVFPQFQNLSLPKRHGSTQMHCNWLDSISCASQQHRSTCKSSDLSQRSLFQSSVAQIGRNWNSGSQLWPHARLSCGALKMYSGPGSTSDQWNLWPRIYFKKKSPGVSTVWLELLILHPVVLCVAPQNHRARSPQGSSRFSHHHNSFISSSQHSIWTSS